MSTELWDLVVKNDVQFSLDVLSQSVMTEEFISKIMMTTLTVLINVTWAD